MELYLQSLMVDICNSVVIGYTNPEIAPVEISDKILYEYNAKDKNEISCGLEGIKFTKFMHCTSTKDIWSTLKSIYEGYEKVKKTKL